MEGKRTRLVLVDDQLLYREGLRGLIEHWPEFEVVGEASNGSEAVCLCSRCAPDLVLMDLQMPVMDGIAAAEAIHERLPDTIIVMLTVATSDELVFDALRTGIRGYLLKDTPARQLRHRLHGILQGDMALSDAVTATVVGELTRLRAAQPRTGVGAGGAAAAGAAGVGGVAGTQATAAGQGPAVQLTQRERDILRLVAQGKSNEEISAELYLSLGTVKKQLGMIMQRLYVENRVQLAVYAVQHNLV